MPTATDDDKERFRSLVPEGPTVDVKPMFGQLGAFVNGNMFAGLFGDSIGVKLPEAAAEELTALGGGPLGPAERPMTGYTTIPTNADADAWMEQALAHVATLPAKPAKPAKQKQPGKA